MEYDEDEQQQPSTPFWLQSTAFRSSTNSSCRRRLGTLITSTSFILLLLVSAALIFIFFLIIPSLFSFTSQIFTPNSVKRTWDSLNLVLVLFAIICAFLGGANNNDNLHSSSSATFTSPSTTSFRRGDREQWYGENSDRSSGIMRLRSISSYPDLRLQHQASPASDSSWDYADYTQMSNRIGNGYRFSDDTQLKSYQLSGSGWQISPRRGRPPPAVEEAKDIDTVWRNTAETEDDENPNKVGASPPRLHTPPPPPPLQPPQPLLPFNPLPELQTRVQPTSRRTYLSTEKAKAREANSDKEQEAKPSPPPRATVRRKTKRIHRSFDEVYDAGDDDQQQKPPSPPVESDVIKKGDRKRGGAAKDFLSSFYSNQKQKKKRERRRSLDNLDYILNRSSSSSTTQPPPPPPPPPPPLPSVFQSLFSSRKGRSKKSASDPPELTQPKSRASKPPTRTAIARPASTTYNYSHQQGTVATGNESPLYGIPEPPPLPPFGMPVWRFVVEGDYVRLKSMNSSRSGSPDLEEDRDDSVRSSYGNGESMRSEVEEVESSAAASPAKFCPSPDVNAKADNFIARFRAGLKLENVNSGNGAGLSRLGLGPMRNK
uniref:Hydroxyproline-rich glycoprotein family protein n=1 Tax=Kalanchoe fedtschenkoi TaxID=63787 RepID=A0A7N0TX20_KALFE